MPPPPPGRWSEQRSPELLLPVCLPWDSRGWSPPRFPSAKADSGDFSGPLSSAHLLCLQQDLQAEPSPVCALFPVPRARSGTPAAARSSKHPALLSVLPPNSHWGLPSRPSHQLEGFRRGEAQQLLQHVQSVVTQWNPGHHLPAPLLQPCLRGRGLSQAPLRVGPWRKPGLDQGVLRPATSWPGCSRSQEAPAMCLCSDSGHQQVVSSVVSPPHGCVTASRDEALQGEEAAAARATRGLRELPQRETPPMHPCGHLEGPGWSTHCQRGTTKTEPGHGGGCALRRFIATALRAVQGRRSRSLPRRAHNLHPGLQQASLGETETHPPLFWYTPFSLGPAQQGPWGASERTWAGTPWKSHPCLGHGRSQVQARQGWESLWRGAAAAAAAEWNRRGPSIWPGDMGCVSSGFWSRAWG